MGGGRLISQSFWKIWVYLVFFWGGGGGDGAAEAYVFLWGVLLLFLCA